MTEGGATTSGTFKRGDVRWRAASGPYIAENTTATPLRIMEIDLKGKPAGPLPVTALDRESIVERRATMTWLNHGGRWQLIAQQVSRLN